MFKILVVDDSTDVREFLVDYVLRPAGYEVLTAVDAHTGFATARSDMPDLIIADMQMPDATGLELLDALTKDNRQVPFILMTSEGSEELATEARLAGAIAYITKPFEPEQMLEHVEQGLNSSKSNDNAVSRSTEDVDVAESLRRHVKQLETIARVGRTVTALLDLDEVLSEVVSAAVNLTGTEEGSILLRDENSGELFMRASKNFDDEFVRTFRLPSDDSLAGQVLRTGEPYLLGQDDPHKIKTSYLVRSLLYVPLNVKGDTIGVLGVDNRVADLQIADEDIQPLQALAYFASIAVENARLFERSEAQRKKFDAVLTKTADAVIVADLSNRLLLINGAARRAFGLEFQELDGLPLEDVLSSPELRDLFLSTTHDQSYQRAEVILDDGRVLNAHLNSIEGVGQAAIMQDITHLKELDKIKSEFVSTVSHDLRSPLTAILGYVELIARAGPVSEQQQVFIERVKVNVNSITSLVTAVLDLGRIEQGFDTQKEEVDLQKVSRVAIESLLGRAHAKGQIVNLDLVENADPVLGNPIRLRQMVANLVDNAIKYTPDAGSISVSLEATGDQLIFIVSDSGIGISPAGQASVFEKFFRSELVVGDEGSEGTGLGLSLVKSIVDNHGGRIWLDSNVGAGTKFTVVLPTDAASVTA